MRCRSISLILRPPPPFCESLARDWPPYKHSTAPMHRILRLCTLREPLRAPCIYLPPADLRSSSMSQKLDKTQLRELFDRVTKQLEGKPVQVEVASLKLGDQIQAQWMPLLGLTYDP